MLGLFDMIAGFPLDGGGVFRAIVWGVSKNFWQATLIAASTGRFFGFLFIIVGVWQVLRGSVGNGLWTALSAGSSKAQPELKFSSKWCKVYWSATRYQR